LWGFMKRPPRQPLHPPRTTFLFVSSGFLRPGPQNIGFSHFYFDLINFTFR
jgi:hypothetical protein